MWQRRKSVKSTPQQVHVHRYPITAFQATGGEPRLANEKINEFGLKLTPANFKSHTTFLAVFFGVFN